MIKKDLIMDMNIETLKHLVDYGVIALLVFMSFIAVYFFIVILITFFIHIYGIITTLIFYSIYICEEQLCSTLNNINKHHNISITNN